MAAYSVYLLDSIQYTSKKLFDISGCTALEALDLARRKLATDGVNIDAPACLDVRPFGAQPYNMRRRYRRIHRALEQAKRAQ